jgi:hypothetical protein
MHPRIMVKSWGTRESFVDKNGRVLMNVSRERKSGRDKGIIRIMRKRKNTKSQSH